MRKIKYIIPMILLFMVIGFATVSISLSINADMELLGDLDDFSVYYSKVLVNGEEDPTVVVSATELDFTTILDKVGTTYTITYDITNASASFDADISISCTGSTEYFSVVNDFDTSTPVPAKGTRTGTLSVSKIKTIAGDEQSNNVSCEVVATPVEIEEEGSGEVPIPLEKYDPYKIGTVLTIGTESFYVIGDDDTSVTMLAQYNLGDDDLQIADDMGTLYYSYDVSTHLDSYADILKDLAGVDDLTVSMMTLSQLGELGCDIDSSTTMTCSNSPYIDLIKTSNMWWFEDNMVVYGTGELIEQKSTMQPWASARAVVTVSKATFDALTNSLLIFSIDGVTYYAEDGMTWGEWMDSEYNIDLQLYVVDFNGYDRVSFSTTYDDMYSWLYYDNTPQDAGFLIINGYAYIKGPAD